MRSKRNRNVRRRPRGRIQRMTNFSGNGSTRSMRFTTLLTRYNLSSAVSGVNSNVLTIAGLIGGDLNGRYLKPVSITARIHPYNQSTSSGSHYSAQLQYADVNNGNLVPISLDKPLSSTVVTTLRGSFPYIVDWSLSSSSTPILNVSVWAQSALATGLFVDLSIVWVVARDQLS
jgi:hypothetical protein